MRIPASAGVRRYVALLRGINVGGKNVIRMTDLKVCVEKLPARDVATFIQSGNVIFSCEEADAAKLTDRIERMLSLRFGYNSRIVLLSEDQLKSAVAAAPEGFGSEPRKYRYDVIFLKPPLAAADAMRQVSLKPGVDRAHAGDGVLYFSRLIAKSAQSHLSRIVQKPVYASMTIRNWNTTTKLAERMKGYALAEFRPTECAK
jgi:uncharacterized protein (DUF1697 family)